MKTSTKIIIFLFLVSLVGVIFTTDYLFEAIIIKDNKVIFNMTALAWISLTFNVVNFIVGNLLYLIFLKTLKINSMIYFATVPLTMILVGVTFFMTGINNYTNKSAVFVKTLLNISNKNNNNYYWILVLAILYLIITFVTVSLITRPIRKIEQVSKKLSFGEVHNKIEIGGNRQFTEIENSLNKINDNYKKKNSCIKKTNIEYQKYIPKRFISFLGKKNISSFEIGTQIRKNATIMFCNITNVITNTNKLSLEENFNYMNSYLNVIIPIIRKNDGFVDKYQNDGIFAVFVSSIDAVKCALSIAKIIRTKNKQNKDFNYNINIGIHTDEIIFGVVGDSKSKSINIISNTTSIVNKMGDVNKKYGSVLIVSKNTLNSLPSSFNFVYRYIGNINLLDKKKYLELFECLNVYVKSKRDKLIKYTTDFETGVKNYYAKNYKESKAIFEWVYLKEKDDKVCYSYYNKSVDNLNRQQE